MHDTSKKLIERPYKVFQEGHFIINITIQIDDIHDEIEAIDIFEIVVIDAV